MCEEVSHRTLGKQEELERKYLHVFVVLVENFDAAKHLNTIPELLGRAHNRPTVEMLHTKKLSTDNKTKIVKMTFSVCSFAILELLIIESLKTLKSTLNNPLG